MDDKAAKASKLSKEWWKSDDSADVRMRGYGFCNGDERPGRGRRIPVGEGFLCNRRERVT